MFSLSYQICSNKAGSANLSATILTSDGPATISIPTSPKTSFFAQATKVLPGPTILSTFSNFFVPYANAAIVCAPPVL